MSELVAFPCRAVTSPNGLKHSVLRRFAAIATGPVMFNHAAGDLEPGGLAVIMVMGVPFLDGAAMLADEELGQVALMTMIAGDEGVERFDAVDEAQFGQEIQRPVNGRRFGAAAFGFQAVEQVIGFDRAAILDNQLQHMLAQRREPLARCYADFARGAQSFLKFGLSHSGLIGEAGTNGKV